MEANRMGLIGKKIRMGKTFKDDGRNIYRLSREDEEPCL